MAEPITKAEWSRVENLVMSSYEGSLIPKHPELVAEDLSTPFLWENTIETIRSRYERQLRIVRKREPLLALGKPSYIFVVSNEKTLDISRKYIA